MSKIKQIPLYLVTYNCNKRGTRIEADKFKLSETFPSELADLYVFGLQELCDIITGCFPIETNKMMIEYNRIFLDALIAKYGEEDVSFHTVSMCHVGAIGLIAITPFPLKFSKIRTGRSRCGYMFSSLKGGIGMRMFYMPYDRNFIEQEATELTFLNVHLPAYEGEYYYQQRNNELMRLIRATDFGDGFGTLKPFSHCFVMGDMNYRTAKKYKRTSPASDSLFGIQDHSKSTDLRIEDIVRQLDELTRAKANGEIFMGFSEACIAFPPTYKYYVNTGIMNTERSPSWCDRILYQSTYKSDKSGFILGEQEPAKNYDFPKIHAYNYIESMCQSDHRPVYLHIRIPIKAPESIISSTGYLQVLPSETPNTHYLHDSAEEISTDLDETVSGPTQIYMKPTLIDMLLQSYIGPFIDTALGHTLWLFMTSRGRLSILGFVIILRLSYMLITHYI